MAPSPASRAATALVGLALAALGYGLANSYIRRHSQHSGFALVPVVDEVRSPRASRPRRTLVVVADGLRLDTARTLRSAEMLREAGQCAPTFVGLPSVSRPVYAVLSTGLEQDRTGARNNDERSPLAVESLWEVAREAGLVVEGRSELAWWKQLFPRGFDRYAEIPRPENQFAAPLAADLTLLHPVYIDEAAHDEGAASPAYASAARRFDDEFLAMLSSMDLGRDLVLLTADHGHRDRGGHGGAEPEVTQVLTCLAGAGVARRPGPPSLDARSVAPALSLLLGLRFPRHMRAVEDDLDVLFHLAAPEAADAPYLADRRAAVERFRAENRRAIAAQFECERWSDAYQRARLPQLARASLVAALTAGALVVRLRSRPGAPWAVAWSVLVAGVFALLYAALAGGLDASSINQRAFFVRNALAAGLGSLALGAVAHVGLLRRRIDHATCSEALALVALGASVAHLAAYGWPLGFPLPSPYVYFAPFLVSSLLLVAGLQLAFASAFAAVRR